MEVQCRGNLVIAVAAPLDYGRTRPPSLRRLVHGVVLIAFAIAATAMALLASYGEVSTSVDLTSGQIRTTETRCFGLLRSSRLTDTWVARNLAPADRLSADWQLAGANGTGFGNRYCALGVARSARLTYAHFDRVLANLPFERPAAERLAVEVRNSAMKDEFRDTTLWLAALELHDVYGRQNRPLSLGDVEAAIRASSESE